MCTAEYLIKAKQAYTCLCMLQITCMKPTDIIYLHSRKLNISAGSVMVKHYVSETEVEVITVKQQTAEPDNDFYILKLDETLEMGKDYVIYLSFRGLLTEGLAGYYRSSYFDRATNSTK